MLGNIIGGLIGAGASLLGGSNAQKSQEKMAEQNIALQKEFAQSGIQWKVQDAKAAGVHPLAALGATTQSFSPVSIGSPAGESMSQAGQFLGRSIAAASTADQRASSALAGLTLERAGLENDLLRSQIARINQQVGPPMPSQNPWLLDGQIQMPGVAVTAGRRGGGKSPSAHEPGSPYSEPHAVPDLGYARGPSGGYAPVPSEPVQERIEDNHLAQMAWMFRNQFLPAMGYNRAPPPGVPRSPGHVWMFNPLTGQYYQMRTDDPPEWFPGNERR